MMEDFNMTVTPADWVVSDSIIKVMGVGGGGCNAVNYMQKQGISGCSFVVCNTDSQALNGCEVNTKIQMGAGLGAGTDPEAGRKAAIESQDVISKVLDTGTKMLFITAGMGGGTGTGATPIIAKMAKDKGILTVAVVTLPFSHEGPQIMSKAIDGIHELQRNVDSMLIINNDKIYKYYGNLLLNQAFPKTDEVLATAVKSIVEIIKKRGYINVDFQDVQNMMKNSGMALMGCGIGEGENRIDDAINAAFDSPLLNDFELTTAKNVLINITCSSGEGGLKAEELNSIEDKIKEHTGGARNFKHGIIFDDDPEFGDKVKITAIATGFVFDNLIGPDVNLGKLIIIGRDFAYDKGVRAGVEIDLPEPDSPARFSSSRPQRRTFNFEADEVPALIVKDGESLGDLEMTTAFQRKQQ